ncbi:hypothetical protein SLAV_05895 [Streptomyces lavendulae subsp. lavendulae]|uniref:Uncharacterized protein n=1 Tax=Streptomyces lavendulae subsp. lavendulae TaxID=58340 RepID=A0A2K8P8L9_STRLA|nr:hypothetical protein SLAV_05895 [Streptomyces lavendulae subsp. lavendulae]QUQ52921.1 hypothetical protein SLLC_03920 [Streptomyces lavendulae subsp. lavendulae]
MLECLLRRKIRWRTRRHNPPRCGMDHVRRERDGRRQFSPGLHSVSEHPAKLVPSDLEWVPQLPTSAELENGEAQTMPPLSVGPLCRLVVVARRGREDDPSLFHPFHEPACCFPIGSRSGVPPLEHVAHGAPFVLVQVDDQPAVQPARRVVPWQLEQDGITLTRLSKQPFEGRRVGNTRKHAAGLEHRGSEREPSLLAVGPREHGGRGIAVQRDQDDAQVVSTLHGPMMQDAPQNKLLLVRFLQLPRSQTIRVRARASSCPRRRVLHGRRGGGRSR